MNPLIKAGAVYREDGFSGLLRSIKNDLYWRFRTDRRFERLRAQWIMYRSSMNVELFRVHWVEPKSIKHVAGTVKKTKPGAYHIEAIDPIPNGGSAGFGAVVGGRWDQNTVRFEKLLTYQSLYDHFTHGTGWDKTELFRAHKNRITKGNRSFNCRSVKELKERFSQYDKLYDQLRSDGYQTQRQRGGNPLDEITVSLGRTGEMLYHGEGRHRLCIAKILNLDEIPVLIHTRHEDLLYPKSNNHNG